MALPSRVSQAETRNVERRSLRGKLTLALFAISLIMHLRSSKTCGSKRFSGNLKLKSSPEGKKMKKFIKRITNISLSLSLKDIMTDNLIFFYPRKFWNILIIFRISRVQSVAQTHDTDHDSREETIENHPHREWNWNVTSRISKKNSLLLCD